MAIQLSGSLQLTGSLFVDGDPVVLANQTSSLNVASASYASTASYADAFTVAGEIVAQTLNVQQVTSSVVYSSGSNVFGNDLSNTQQFTGSLQVSGSTHYMLGNVGIGTDSPSSLLNIVSATNNSSALIVQDDARKVKIGRDQIAVTDLSDVAVTMYLQPSANLVINNSAGNVGIGTQPSYKLDVNGSAQVQDYLRITNTAGGQKIVFGNQDSAGANNPSIILAANGNTFIGGGDSWTGDGGSINYTATFSDSGDVGIGTTLPNTKLDVSGSVSVAGGSEGLRIGNVGDNSAYDNVKIYYSGYNGGSPEVVFTPRTTPGSGALTTYFRFKNSNGTSSDNNIAGLTVDGSVGIGTTSPSDILDVRKNQNATTQFYFRNTDTTDASSRAYFNLISGDTSLTLAAIHGLDTYIAGTSGRKMYFQQSIGGTVNMIIDSTGNVGINQTNPSQKLHVSDVGAIISGGNAISTSTMKGIILQNTNNGDESIGLWFNTGGSHWSGITGQRNDAASTWGTDLRFYTHENAFVDLTYARERMRITSEGNVGIGTTGAGYPLVVRSSESVVAAFNTYQTGDTSTSIDIGGYGDTTGAVRIKALHYHAATTATSMAFLVNNSTLEAMRISSTGALLVGGTNTFLIGTAHLLQGSSSTSGAAPVIVYNDTGTASCPALNVALRDESTDSTARFIQFYSSVGATAQAMGGIVGNGAENAQFLTLSDEREKENITEISGSLNKIMQLQVSEFNWKKTNEYIPAGFIAQNVELVFPEYVVENAANNDQEPRKGITGGMSGGYIAHLTRAIQELKAENDSLKSRLEALEQA